MYQQRLRAQGRVLGCLQCTGGSFYPAWKFSTGCSGWFGRLELVWSVWSWGKSYPFSSHRLSLQMTCWQPAEMTFVLCSSWASRQREPIDRLRAPLTAALARDVEGCSRGWKWASSEAMPPASGRQEAAGEEGAALREEMVIFKVFRKSNLSKTGTYV